MHVTMNRAARELRDLDTESQSVRHSKICRPGGEGQVFGRI
jgi:hypothetical protein